MPDTLIETLAHLQQHVSVAYGRHLLLDYARKSVRARLGLLLRVDILARQLVLVERCGRAPLNAHLSAFTHISLDGLFSAALNQQGLLRVADIYSDPRSLPEEQSQAWQGGQVLLCAVGTLSKSSGAPGVMVLCAEPHPSDPAGTLVTAQGESEMLICAALLGAYLEDTSEETLAAVDRERSRIARDIHDGAAQGIAHAIHALELAQRILEKQPQVARREIHHARETLLESLNDLRHDISALLPPQLEQANFAEAVQGLLDDFSRHERTITLRRDGIPINYLPPSLEAPLYRFLQEALHNVRKHAHATDVSVQIQAMPGLLVARVSDDGVGFSVEQVRRQSKDAAKNGTLVGFGLRAMHERIEQAGGVLEIISKPGNGTTIKARFQLAYPPIALTNREREVLRLLADGATNRVIAAKLSLSIETVKSHVHHIMQKLQVKDRTQAAVLAARKQWV
ncbi:MAG TPA: LuxR C-terminal-related transcriptional regulator [Ktedonobacteraceae bacterium]|nr:LuxR C-terminal-related transcriptional regulator [Ktedonobacteraceae bacterium]